MEEQAEKSKPTAIEFVKDKLRQNPEAPFADIKAQGRLEGLTIYPVVYGRAKALLGLVPTAPYGSKAKARRKAREEREDREDRDREDREGKEGKAAREDREHKEHRASATGGSETGGMLRLRSDSGAAKPRKVARSTRNDDPFSSLEKLVDDLRTAVEQRDRYREMLEKIMLLLQAELGRD